MQNEEFKQLIFDLVNGCVDISKVDIAECPVEEIAYVENEFCCGKVCDKAYADICLAKQNIYDRMGVNEDRDIECIMDNFTTICRHLCMKMYDYGVHFAKVNSK